jgi:hypothetical protein
MEKGELPPALEASINDKKDDSDEKKPEMADKKDEKKEDDEKMKDNFDKSEYSDVISAEYLNWMEDTLKSAGVNTGQARAHFDQMEKAQLGGFDNPDSVDGADYFAGQVRGRGQENGGPSTGAISALTSSGGKSPAGALGPVSMSKGYLNPATLSESEIEAAYEVYKAAAIEQQFRGSLEGHFQGRFAKEQQIAKSEADRRAFDARDPVSDLQKSISALNERIDNLSTESTTISKSDSDTILIDVPSTQDLAHMGWDEVHRLAGEALRGA